GRKDRFLHDHTREACGAACLNDGGDGRVSGSSGLSPLLQICPSTEGPPSTSDDGSPDVLLLTHPLECLHERAAEFAVYSVAYCRAVKSDDSYLVGQLKKHSVTAHTLPPLVSCLMRFPRYVVSETGACGVETVQGTLIYPDWTQSTLTTTCNLKRLHYASAWLSIVSFFLLTCTLQTA